MTWKIGDTGSGICAVPPPGFTPDEKVVVEVTFEDATVNMGIRVGDSTIA